MKKNWPLFLLCSFIIIYTSCKPEEKGKNDFWPVNAFIGGQVRHVETSLYGIIKVDVIDSTRRDTSYISRENFRGLAKDFLETPDLTEKSIGKKYKEEQTFDESMNRAIFTYTPQKKNLEVTREDVIVIPDPPDNDKVRSIYIERTITKGDSTVIKRMTWYADWRFQIATIVQKKDQPEIIKVTEVIWNDTEQ